MPGQAAKVVITEKQQVVLRELASSRSACPMHIQRAKVILLAFAGRLNEEIAEQVGLGRNQIGIWRRRWQQAWPELTNFECAEPRKLRAAIGDLLSDAPGRGTKPTFTAEQLVMIVAVACEPPELSGRPITQWTIAELKNEVVKRGIVASISDAHVWRILQRAVLQPHRKKMWLNTTEKDPVIFQQQVERVCQAYHDAPKLHAKDGTRTACIDEMTGIQALERNAPDKPPQPGEVAKLEFEYTRHGTTTLIGNLDVVSGEMFSTTIGPTRTEEDFVAHIQQTVASDADASWVLIADNLNTHCSAGLVEYIAKLCEPETELGKKRCIGHSQIGRHPQGISGVCQTSDSVCVFAEA